MRPARPGRARTRRTEKGHAASSRQPVASHPQDVCFLAGLQRRRFHCNGLFLSLSFGRLLSLSFLMAVPLHRFVSDGFRGMLMPGSVPAGRTQPWRQGRADPPSHPPLARAPWTTASNLEPSSLIRASCKAFDDARFASHNDDYHRYAEKEMPIQDGQQASISKRRDRILLNPARGHEKEITQLAETSPGRLPSTGVRTFSYNWYQRRDVTTRRPSAAAATNSVGEEQEGRLTRPPTGAKPPRRDQ